MDILARLLGSDLRADGAPSPLSDYWYRPVGQMTDAGVMVDVDTAKKLSAWYRGRDILATVLAMLPLQLFERLPDDGGAQPAKAHPLYDVLHDKPNVYQDSFQWRRQKMYHLIDYGNGYDLILAGTRGFVDQLRPLHPTLVTPTQLSTGRISYSVRDAKTNQATTYTQDEIFHLRGSSDDGVCGKGILEYARASLGTASATESYAANIFSRGTLNGGVIENPGTLDKEASQRMALSFVTASKNWHLPKILEQGSKFVPNLMTPEDAQMLVSRKYTVDDIARWLGVPRLMLENSDPSFGNAEQFTQNFIDFNMGPWLSLWECAFSDQLILAPRKYFAQFTRQALVRGNFKDRVEGLVAEVNAGIITVDEARAVEDMNKRGGKADELRDPQNITGKPAATAPTADPPPVPPQRAPKADASGDHLRAIVTESAARLVRKEQMAAHKAAVKHAADADGFAVWATDFYADHQPLVAQTLQLEAVTAQLYCDSQRDALIAHGIGIAETWDTAYLVGVALDDKPRPTAWQTLAETQAKQSHTITVHGAPVTIEKGAIATTVSPAPVAVHQAPVTVNGAPVTIAEGAIVSGKPKTIVVSKKVKRNAQGQITEVIERHTAEED